MAGEIVANGDRSEPINAAEVDKALLYGCAVVPQPSPQDRMTSLMSMRRGSEAQINILRLRYEVANAIGAEAIKADLRKEAEMQIRALKYIDAELAKLDTHGR